MSEGPLGALAPRPARTGSCFPGHSSGRTQVLCGFAVRAFHTSDENVGFLLDGRGGGGGTASLQLD